MNKNAVLRLSSCVNVNLTGDCYCFDRRRTDDPPQEIWARRLQSPWGIHWRCEELSGKPQHSSAWSLMASCKSIFQDIVNMMARQCTVHIAHLATMDVVFSGQKSNPQMHQTYIDQCITTAFSETKDLDLMLRLPPSTYDDIARDLSRPDAPLPLVPLHQQTSPVVRWARVWPAIAALPRLRRLHLKLDHDSESSWLIVNEQAILLRPLFAFSAQPRVQIYLSLPEVTHEEPPVSSLRENTWVPVSLRLNRFPRQRFFPERRIDGSIGIVYEEDVRLI
ncbi:hypothetical protein AAL_03514 [Moelleriella libera RCEF 2490]|uniref:Uncharacterized protein n=1 Tax=Moelleriella libera RCEF 2490 TaxID=1081109 RepID=A0A166PLB6_9HYPO|nr:hypothetical protein AAL_03514 [Moelleriella libera RCEF 2490]